MREAPIHNLVTACFWIPIVGADGSVTRSLIMQLTRWTALPRGTLMIHVIGSFALGLTQTLLARPAQPAGMWQSALYVGLLGAFAIFSNHMFETDKMLNSAEGCAPHPSSPPGIFLGLLAVRIGIVTTRALGFRAEPVRACRSP